MIYFTSDLHLGHTAVINMQCRPYESVEEMNELSVYFLHLECHMVHLGDYGSSAN